MKLNSGLCFALLAVVAIVSTKHCAVGFGVVSIRPRTNNGVGVSSPSYAMTQRFMFGGSGGGGAISALEEFDPEQEAQIEATAKAMGVSPKEYKLILKSQENMTTALTALRVSGGKSATCTVEIDGNSPPKHINIKITDEGKALGKELLEKEIVAALKEANLGAKKGQEAVMKQMQDDIAAAYKTMGM